MGGTFSHHSACRCHGNWCCIIWCSTPHGGTTEEGNCSYLLPRATAAGSKGINKGQIPKVPFDESARCLVYRMDVTRSQFSANTEIPVCLVREIWQFKVLTGKEVTPLHEEGNSLQICAGKKATHFRNKWFIDIWQTDKTESQERSQCEIVKWKYVSRCDEQTKTTCLIRPRGDVKFYCHVKWQQNAIFMGLYRRTLFGNILTGFWVYFMWRWILSD